MLINVSIGEACTIIAALGETIRKYIKQAEQSMNLGDKLAFMDAIWDVSIVQENIRRQVMEDYGTSIAVEVKDGMVQNVYANTNVSVEIYDLDGVPEDPDYAKRRAEALKMLINQPDWREVL